MPKNLCLKVTKENLTGRNEKVQDMRTNEELTWREVVQKIACGTYDDYHVRRIKGVKTPVSNPDRTKNNNLDASQSLPRFREDSIANGFLPKNFQSSGMCNKLAARCLATSPRLS